MCKSQTVYVYIHVQDCARLCKIVQDCASMLRIYIYILQCDVDMSVTVCSRSHLHFMSCLMLDATCSLFVALLWANLPQEPIMILDNPLTHESKQNK